MWATLKVNLDDFHLSSFRTSENVTIICMYILHKGFFSWANNGCVNAKIEINVSLLFCARLIFPINLPIYTIVHSETSKERRQSFKFDSIKRIFVDYLGVSE